MVTLIGECCDVHRVMLWSRDLTQSSLRHDDAPLPGLGNVLLPLVVGVLGAGVEDLLLASPPNPVNEVGNPLESPGECAEGGVDSLLCL